MSTVGRAPKNSIQIVALASLIGTMANMVYALADLSVRLGADYDEALELPVTIDEAIESAIRSLDVPIDGKAPEST